jgi:hypothetical protein
MSKFQSSSTPWSIVVFLIKGANKYNILATWDTRFFYYIFQQWPCLAQNYMKHYTQVFEPKIRQQKQHIMSFIFFIIFHKNNLKHQKPPF